MRKCCLFDIQNLSHSEYRTYYSLMSKERKRDVDRLHCLADKKRCVAGEMLARKIIAEYCNVTEEEIHFRKTVYGKPFAIGLPVEFNVSHSGNAVACAVSNAPIGIDVEEIRSVDLHVVKHICTKDELVYLFGHLPDANDYFKTNEQELLIRFFRIWTAKEAYFKCLGTGITNLKTIDYKNLCETQRLDQNVAGNTVVSIWC